MSCYKSCNCKSCRHVSSAIKGEHKRQAHRSFRRAFKADARRGDFEIKAVSSGYKA